MYSKDELETAVLSCLDGRILGSSNAVIRYYVARHIFGIDHHSDLPHQSITGACRRLFKAGKIRGAMGDGWVIDPKGPCAHMSGRIR